MNRTDFEIEENDGPQIHSFVENPKPAQLADMTSAERTARLNELDEICRRNRDEEVDEARVGTVPEVVDLLELALRQRDAMQRQVLIRDMELSRLRREVFELGGGKSVTSRIGLTRHH